MKFNYRKSGVLILFSLSILFFARYPDSLTNTYRYLSGIFFAEKITPDILRSEYASSTLKVLIVPGHEKDTGGTEFRGVNERDLVLALGKYLQAEFENDSHISSQLTRGGDGDFTSWFKEYIGKNSINVKVFRKEAREKTEAGVQSGLFIPSVVVDHNEAPGPVALLLYGINKYANEHGVDLVLHLHLNDYSGRRAGLVSKYQGFAIYVPEGQLPNARASKDIAASLRDALRIVEPSSNFSKEKPGLVDDQELIAIGSNGTRDGVSLLIEYGYIYEQKFIDPTLRVNALRDLAHATYLGIQNYFTKTSALSVSR